MKEALLEKLRPVNQEHLIQFWDQLSAQERDRLAAQIQNIDFEEFNQLRIEHAGNQIGDGAAKQFWRDVASRSTQPKAIRLGKDHPQFTRADALKRGEAALRQGKIGMILVAGGLGTRLGFDLPKGMFPLGPVSKRPLFQILIDQLRAVAKRYGTRIPLFVMTSPATHDVTEKFLAENDRFGLPAEDLQLFQQGTMYAVREANFEIVLSAPGEIFTGPDGHGGMLKALVKTGVLDDAKQRGIEHFFYGQIDNPLLAVCDAELLGSHVLAGSELTTQVVAKVDPKEKVGIVVEVDGRTQIIEYVDLPDDLTQERLPDGTLRFWAGNIAVHVFDVDFLRRTASMGGALPFHTSQKKVPYVDPAGELVNPTAPNAIRFERFIFDLLPHATTALVVEVDKAEAFAPVKNDDKAPSDSPTTARAAMVAKSAKLLAEAGVAIDSGVDVEVNPMWAIDSLEAQAKLGGKARITSPTYFV